MRRNQYKPRTGTPGQIISEIKGKAFIDKLMQDAHDMANAIEDRPVVLEKRP
ncbi:MAG: hypothetical protein KIT13_11765 [Burkholderiales bacterium]|nr:hypothetical protein [Burkholderiales bacterium]